MEEKNIAQLFQKMLLNYNLILGEYEKFFDAVKKEREYIGNGSFDDLDEILSTKTGFIDKIERMNSDLEKIMNEICSVLNVKEVKLESLKHIIPDVVYNDLHEIQTKLETLISEIIAEQDENQRILKDDFGEIKKDIIKIKSSRKVIESYSSTVGEYESRFIDKIY